MKVEWTPEEARKTKLNWRQPTAHEPPAHKTNLAYFARLHREVHAYRLWWGWVDVSQLMGGKSPEGASAGSDTRGGYGLWPRFMSTTTIPVGQPSRGCCLAASSARRNRVGPASAAAVVASAAVPVERRRRGWRRRLGHHHRRLGQGHAHLRPRLEVWVCRRRHRRHRRRRRCRRSHRCRHYHRHRQRPRHYHSPYRRYCCRVPLRRATTERDSQCRRSGGRRPLGGCCRRRRTPAYTFGLAGRKLGREMSSLGGCLGHVTLEVTVTWSATNSRPLGAGLRQSSW
jgi:hypothetical protein